MIRAREHGVFVGRGKLLRRIEKRLSSQARFAVLVGPAGYGKTALARHFVTLAGDRYGDPVWCDAAQIRSLDRLASHVIAAAGAVCSPEAWIESPWRAVLAHRGRTLLVLDDADGLERDALAIVARWTAEAQGIAVIATRRGPVVDGDEFGVEVGPLSIPRADRRSEALELLVDRASRIRSDIAFGHDDPDLIALATRLDGIPLAIELAASRLAILSPKELLARLEDRFALLRREPTSKEDRHASLEGALSSSWALLEPWERAALIQCSVFAADFDPAAAEAVVDLCGYRDAPPILAALEALSGAAWVAIGRAPEGHARWRLLPTIRLFVRAHGDEAVVSTAHARYLAHYRSLGHELTALGRSSERARASRRLGEEQAHFRELVSSLIPAGALAQDPGNEEVKASPTERLAILVDLEPVVRTALSPRECEQAIERLLGEAAPLGEVSDALAAKARLMLGRARACRGDVRTAARTLREALEIASRGKDRALEGEVIGSWASARSGADDYRAAYEEIADVMVRGEGRLAPGRIAHLHFLLGTIAGELSDSTRQEQHVKIALGAFELLEGCELESALGAVLREAACVAHLDAGNLEQAVREAEALAGIAAESARSKGAYLRACALLLEGRLEQALRLLRGAEAELERCGLTGRARASRLQIARVYRDLGRGEDARDALSRLSGMPASHAAFAEGFRGAVEASLGNFDRAERLLAAARRELEHLGAAALLEALSFEEGHVEIARAHAAASDGEPKGLEEALSRAGSRLAKTAEPSSFQVRVSRRSLRDALDRCSHLAAARAKGGLVVQGHGEWFAMASHARVECARRPVSRKLLAALAGQHELAPGEPIPIDQLIRTVWPTDSVDARSRTRLHQAIRGLRELGLSDVLEQVGSGYRLRPSRNLRIVL